jgi:hypothetical protein
MKKIIFTLVILLGFQHIYAQQGDILIGKLKDKLAKVKDYFAIAQLKTDVAFLKLPISKVSVSYKYPDQFQIKKEGGVSILPKGGMSVNLNSLILEGNYVVIPGGNAVWKGAPAVVLKLVPTTEGADLIILTLYINEADLLIKKAIATTKQNGTYELELDYGKYAQWGLPDNVRMLFNTKEFSLPKAVTLEYEGVAKNKKVEKKGLPNKGVIEIRYLSYVMNKG